MASTGLARLGSSQCVVCCGSPSQYRSRRLLSSIAYRRVALVVCVGGLARSEGSLQDEPANTPMLEANDSSDRISVLLISSLREDHIELKRIFQCRKWRLHQIPTCGEAATAATRSNADVVICERSLPDGDWKLILEKLNSLSERPSLIVTSRLADDELWAEVLNLGGYDVLAQPFRCDEVCYVVLRAWERARRPRGQLETATQAR